MSDGDAYAVFVALHIPLLGLVLRWTGSTVLRSHADHSFHTTRQDGVRGDVERRAQGTRAGCK